LNIGHRRDPLWEAEREAERGQACDLRFFGIPSELICAARDRKSQA